MNKNLQKIKFKAFIFFVSAILIAGIQKAGAQSCVLGVSDEELFFPSYQDLQHINVIRNPQYCTSWEAYTNDSWISIWADYYYGGVDIGTDDNESEDARVGYVYIDNSTVTIHQEGFCQVPAQFDTIYGATCVCKSTQVGYSVDPVSGTTNYHWSISNGGIIVGGQGSMVIMASFPNPGSATVSVYASKPCGSSTPTEVNVTIFPESSLDLENRDTIKLGPCPVLSGKHDLIARDEIIMLPGFVYTASSSDSLNASINPYLAVKPEGAITGGPGGEIGLMVGDDGVVGAIPGQFAVNKVGAATYSVPIECPPGINGMTPSVSLSYNSQAGNGIAGWGWNITGVSSITRVPKSFYYDSAAREILWNGDDPFALDGMRLFIKNRYPTNSTQTDADSIEYYQESDNSTKIIGYDFEESGPDRFKVWTGNGRILEYNQKQNLDSSKVETSYYKYYSYPDNPILDSTRTYDSYKTLGWYLTSVSDYFGNKIEYNYAQTYTAKALESTDLYYEIGESYFHNHSEETGYKGYDFALKDIEYAGGDFRINFLYQGGSDQNKYYINGEELKQTKIPTSITVSHEPESTIIKNYLLDYYLDGSIKLREVRLIGMDSEEYNSTIFDWSNENYNYNLSTYISLDNSTYHDSTGYNLNRQNYWPGDFNGDGLTDFFVTQLWNNNGNREHWAVYYNPGTSTPWAIQDEGEFIGDDIFYIFDKDLDGKDELYFPCGTTENGFDYVKYLAFQDTLDSFCRTENVDFKIRLLDGAEYNEVNLVHSDFDGDGDQEYILLNNEDLSGNNIMGFNESFSIPWQWDYYSSSGYEITDINGNGKKEIVFKRSNSLEIWEYDYNSFDHLNMSIAANGDDKLYFDDYNGDGNDDLLFYDVSEETWVMLTSTGKGYSSDIITPPSLSAPLTSNSRLLTGDINQDGRADIIEIRYVSPDNDQMRVYISKGISFDLKLTQGGLSDMNFISGGNVDKDLATEVFATLDLDVTNPRYFSFTPASGSNHINKIISGLGNETDILYDNSIIPYSKENASAEKNLMEEDYTNIISTPLHSKVVSNVSTGSASTDYSFEDPIILSNGIGFMGFESIYDTVKIGNVQMGSHYEHDSLILKGNSGKYELLPDTTINKKGDNNISEAFYYYSPMDVAGIDHIVADSIVTVDLLNDVKIVKSFHDYNAYLIPEVLKTKYYADDTEEARITDSLTFSNTVTGGKWFIGQLAQKKTIQKRPGERDYRRVFDYDYNSSTGALNNEYTEKNTSKEIQKSYEYDSYGNISSVTTVAPEDANDSREREISMSYYDGGRLLKSTRAVSGNRDSLAYYDETGLIKSKRDINGLTTQYFYDGFGRLNKTIYPDNNEEVNMLLWTGDNEDSPTGALYFNYKQISGDASLTTFYDKDGKELRRVILGLSEDKIYTDKQYDNSDRLWKVSLPYLSTGTPLWTTFTYDELNRLSKESYPDGRLKNFAFDARETTIESGTENETQTTIKRTNSLGETIESTDDIGNTVVTRYFASGLPKEMQIQGESHKTKFTYDIYGNRDTISDPDAGGIISVYNTLGYLISQTDSIGNITAYTYDIAGRVLSRTADNVETEYTYDTDIKGAISVINDEYNTITYEYDNLGRLENSEETIAEPGENKTLSMSYTYDQFGRLKTKTWSTGYEITNEYNNSGYLVKIKDLNNATLWQATGENALGQITGYSQGSYSTSVSYNNFGDLEDVVTTGVRNMSYGFDDYKNLALRQDNLTGQKEEFSYDNLNRLTGVTNYHDEEHEPGGDRSVSYDDLGNITGKTGVAAEDDIKYGEDNAGPHALTSITNPEGYLPLNQDISYTSFNKVEAITDTLFDDTIRKFEFKYGIDQQRKRSMYTEGSLTIKKYFFDDYEEVNDGSTIKKYHYISSPTGLCAIFVIEGSAGKLYYTFTDHLGSLTEVADVSTSNVSKQSFDAWGNMRSVSDWTDAATYTLFAGRGFTGHEHLEVFDLINMNGRVYDPVLGRFLSPDPFVQAPDFSQNFNRYSYCINNPLKYTDPSGEFLTWSFHNGGFSIGFNLSPIGIPLGAGINIGWGNGFSLGGYGEVGYRVGGTGFGSGATVSQSFDYNFKNNGWSGTTAEGAYASLGGFNAGANISQTYDFASNSWSNGWGVSAGIGFGNDARGIGFNIGYGSSGFTYGMGGYYNSRAWDSNPVYEPEAWNDNGEIQTTNNCYSYALDDRENGNYWGLQPGDAGGQPLTSLSDVTLEYVTNAAISDGRIRNPNFWNKLGFGKRGYYSAYLVIDEGVDYHWYRQDKGGLWSHKPGITPVLNVDASPHLIINPAFANHGNYNNGGRFLWIKRK